MNIRNEVDTNNRVPSETRHVSPSHNNKTMYIYINIYFYFIHYNALMNMQDFGTPEIYSCMNIHQILVQHQHHHLDPSDIYI